MVFRSAVIETPMIIAITGSSGSGKSTFAKALKESLAKKLDVSVLLFTMDDYYKNRSDLEKPFGSPANFDCPSSLDEGLLKSHLESLRQGKQIDRPVYDFSTSARVEGQVVRVTPQPVIILEGVFALSIESIRPYIDTSIFLDAPMKTCLERRVARDQTQRGRTSAQTTQQWKESVLPMFKKHVLPAKERADYIFDLTLRNWSK